MSYGAAATAVYCKGMKKVYTCSRRDENYDTPHLYIYKVADDGPARSAV